MFNNKSQAFFQQMFGEQQASNQVPQAKLDEFIDKVMDKFDLDPVDIYRQLEEHLANGGPKRRDAFGRGLISEAEVQVYPVIQQRLRQRFGF